MVSQALAMLQPQACCVSSSRCAGLSGAAFSSASGVKSIVSSYAVSRRDGRALSSKAAASKFGSSFLSGPAVSRSGLFPLNASLNSRLEERRPRKGSLVVRASAVESGADEGAAPDGSTSPVVPAQPSELAKTLQLGSLFGLWYLFNIYFNIYNKQACSSGLLDNSDPVF